MEGGDHSSKEGIDSSSWREEVEGGRRPFVGRKPFIERLSVEGGDRSSREEEGRSLGESCSLGESHSSREETVRQGPFVEGGRRPSIERRPFVG
jgi:hypothetical protein